jgi:hypothetical protein
MTHTVANEDETGPLFYLFVPVTFVWQCKLQQNLTA